MRLDVFGKATAIIAALAGGRHACADVAYVTDQSTYYVAPGGVATVHVFAAFRGADVMMLGAENGLYSVGVSLVTTSSSPMDTPAVLMSEAAAMLNVSDFDDSFGPLVDSPITPRFGAVLLTDPFGNDGDRGVLGNPSGADRLVPIGTFAYTASMNVGEGTTIVVGDYDDQLSDTVTWETFQVLDGAMTPVRIGIVVTNNPACPADINNDGVVGSQDFFNFLVAYFEGNGNFNGIDGTDSQDLFDFLIAFFNGC